MKESTIVARIMKAIRQRYPTAYVRKISDRFTRGIPDIVACVRGHAIFIEVKKPGGKLSAIQRKELREIDKAAGHACVAASVDDVMWFFNGLEGWSDW